MEYWKNGYAGVIEWWKVVGLREPVAEYRFAPPRRWRFDYCWPDRKVALEVEGGAWVQGRHTRGSGFVKDMEKYNHAAHLGWRIYRATPRAKMPGIPNLTDDLLAFLRAEVAP